MPDAVSDKAHYLNGAWPDAFTVRTLIDVETIIDLVSTITMQRRPGTDKSDFCFGPCGFKGPEAPTAP